MSRLDAAMALLHCLVALVADPFKVRSDSFLEHGDHVPVHSALITFEGEYVISPSLSNSPAMAV